jgi:hypothetical protein
MRGAVKARRHPRRGAVARGSGGAKELRPGPAGAVGKTELANGPHVSVGG